jgi:hypothetical protein
VAVHGGLNPLVNIIKSPKDIYARRAALKAILNMSTNAELLAPLTQKGIIELIIKITSAADEEMKSSALFTLCNLVGVADKATIVSLVRGGCCVPLIGLASSDDCTCRCLAIVALRKLSTAEFAKLPMLRAGILDAAFDWLMRTAVHAFQQDPNNRQSHHHHHHNHHQQHQESGENQEEEAEDIEEEEFLAESQSGSSDSDSSDSDSDSNDPGSIRSKGSVAEASIEKSVVTNSSALKPTKAQLAVEKKKQKVKYIKKIFGRAKHAVGEELEVISERRQ